MLNRFNGETGMTKYAAAADCALALLHERSRDATVCPSEVARAIVAGESADPDRNWRTAMPDVHAAIDLLVATGKVTLTWRGQELKTRKGPYRIGRGKT
jgi:hypothetical protein